MNFNTKNFKNFILPAYKYKINETLIVSIRCINWGIGFKFTKFGSSEFTLKLTLTKDQWQFTFQLCAIGGKTTQSRQNKKYGLFQDGFHKLAAMACPPLSTFTQNILPTRVEWGGRLSLVHSTFPQLLVPCRKFISRLPPVPQIPDNLDSRREI